MKSAPCVSPHFCTEGLRATVLDEKPGTVKPGLSVIIPRPLTPDANGRGTLLQVLLFILTSRVFESEPTATDRRDVRHSKPHLARSWLLGLSEVFKARHLILMRLL